MFWFVTAFGIPESLIELSELPIGLPSSQSEPRSDSGKVFRTIPVLAVYNPKHTSGANKHGVVSHNRHHILLILIQNTMHEMCFNSPPVMCCVTAHHTLVSI
jgi:hypothetical protein